MEHKHHSGGFSNGFLLGLLVGVGAVLLFTTKKGKKLLRSLSEDGLENITNLDDLLRKVEHVMHKEDVVEEDNDYVPPKKVLLPEVVEKKEEVKPEPVHREEKSFDAAQDDRVEGKEKVEEKKEEEKTAVHHDVPETKSKPTRRRFFRGIPKRG